MPPEAAPWEIVQIIGRPSIATLWKGCFDAGFAAGEAATYFKAWGSVLVFIIAILAVAALLKDKR